MTRVARAGQDELLAVARDDHGSVIDLTARLVRIPSQAGIDPYGPVLDELHTWFIDRGLTARQLRDDAGDVGVVCEVAGRRPGPRWVLNACVDTAPFGDESAWSHPPTGAVIEDGWLWGRGASDSKVGAAIFCHIASRLAAVTDELAGRLVVLLDADEHSGRFGGALRYFAGPGAPTDVAGVLIGYPGLDKVVVGSRGVYRARLTVHGVAAHSGSTAHSPNAIDKAADLVHALRAVELPTEGTPGFPLAPQLTVTAIRGGQGYATVPDICDLRVDVRTTPRFDTTAAHDALALVVAEVDAAWPKTRPTRVTAETSWPAYRLGEQDRLRSSLLQAAKAHGVAVRPKISGPSNIGNYLATLAIPATAGFGVDYRGLHAADERISLSTIPSVQAIYHATALDLLTPR